MPSSNIPFAPQKTWKKRKLSWTSALHDDEEHKRADWHIAMAKLQKHFFFTPHCMILDIFFFPALGGRGSMRDDWKWAFFAFDSRPGKKFNFPMYTSAWRRHVSEENDKKEKRRINNKSFHAHHQRWSLPRLGCDLASSIGGECATPRHFGSQ